MSLLSNAQMATLLALWAVAIIPLGTALVVFVLTRLGVVTTPIPNHYRGAKMVGLLCAGGWVGIRLMAGGFGVAAAVAGIWLGLAGLHWDHLLVIALSAPALTVIACSAMIIFVGSGVELKDETKPRETLG